MSGFTDIHAHVVYGLDDGARTCAEMEDMLDAAFADGVSFLYATSHVIPGLKPFDWMEYQDRLEEARAYCRKKGYDLRILPGAEVMYSPALRRFAEEEKLPVLGDSRFVLMEFVPNVAFSEMESAVALLERCGYVPILAHIERYSGLTRLNARRLKEKHDVRYQVSCGTVIASRGLWRGRRIRGWLKERLVDFVASDAHDCHRRVFRMREAGRILEQMYGEAYAQNLMCGQFSGVP